MTATLFATARKTPALRDYQKDVIDRVRARARGGRHRRIILQASCGAGKTHCSSEIVRLAYEKGKTCLFLAHRRKLIGQKSERLHEFGVPHSIIMAGEDFHRDAQVHVASKDTLLSRGVRRSRMELPDADLLIIDECHLVGSDGEYLSLLEAYPNAVVIGLTATPARSDGTGLGHYFTAMECAVPTSQLIREGHLVPFRCFAPDEVGKKLKAGKNASPGIWGDPVAQWKNLACGRPTVLFAGKVQESMDIVASFNAAGVAAEHVDARTPDGEREEVYDRVREGKTLVLGNCGILTEGVDLPMISCVQFARKAGSYVLFAQGCGRAARPYDGKKDAVLIDHAGAVFKHGFPDEDVEWALDEKDSVERRIKEKKAAGQMREPILCPSCSYLFSNSAICPNCGKALPRSKKRKEVLTQDTLLTEVDREKRPVESPEQRQARARKEWVGFVYLAVAKGQRAGAAAAMFRSKFKCWPNEVPGIEGLPRGNQWREPAERVFPWAVRRKDDGPKFWE